MSETSTIVTPLIDALNGIPGVWARRVHSGKVPTRGGWMNLGDIGAPDVLCIVRGLPVFFEAKLAKGLVTEEQCREHGRIRRAGGVVHVVRSVGQAMDVVRGILAMPDEERRGA